MKGSDLGGGLETTVVIAHALEAARGDGGRSRRSGTVSLTASLEGNVEAISRTRNFEAGPLSALETTPGPVTYYPVTYRQVPRHATRKKPPSKEERDEDDR